MSPTFEVPAGFARELTRLSREQNRAFRQAVRKLVDALKEGREPPRSLRIKRVQGTKERSHGSNTVRLGRLQTEEF